MIMVLLIGTTDQFQHQHQMQQKFIQKKQKKKCLRINKQKNKYILNQKEYMLHVMI